MSVSHNIKRLRNLAGISQEDLAQIAGVSRAAVSLWEIGETEPRMGAIQRIADHFGIRKTNIIEEGGMDRIVANISGRLVEMPPEEFTLSEDEKELVRLYRSTDDRGRVVIITVARAQSGVEGEISSALA